VWHCRYSSRRTTSREEPVEVFAGVAGGTASWVISMRGCRRSTTGCRGSRPHPPARGTAPRNRARRSKSHSAEPLAMDRRLFRPLMPWKWCIAAGHPGSVPWEVWKRRDDAQRLGHAYCRKKRRIQTASPSTMTVRGLFRRTSKSIRLKPLSAFTNAQAAWSLLRVCTWRCTYPPDPLPPGAAGMA
jgi:hypothetical protein